MSITTDVRKYGETVLEQSKIALDEARKPWLAAVGATDLAVGQLREQLKDLPTEVETSIRRLQSGAGQIDAARLRSTVETAATQAKVTYGAYVAQAREAYDTLAHRGDLVVRRLRRSPEVGEAFGKAEQLLTDAENTVEKAQEKVEQAEAKVTRPAGTTRKAPARKAAAKRPGNKA
jgi:ABC-type transporter Mla subunit MlaD